MKYLIRIFLFLFIVLISSISADAQTPAVSDLAVRINRERTARGLVPYALNSQLLSAAQAQANDMSRNGNYSHNGADGSTATDRIARAGYGAYSWGRRVGENWAWYRDADTAMKMWMDSAPHRSNILNLAYREFGIGISPAQTGGFLFVVDFGAQPSILPIFISDDAAESGNATTTLTLSNEEAAPNGDGANTIGRAVEIQVSGNQNFSGAQWQPFTTRLAWILSNKTVFVKFRDARGRTATSSTTINSREADSPVPNSQVAASPTPTATATRPRPTATRTATRLPTTTSTTVNELATPTLVGATETPTIQLTSTPFRLASQTEFVKPPTEATALTSAESPFPPIIWGIFGIGFVAVVFVLMRLFSR